MIPYSLSICCSVEKNITHVCISIFTFTAVITSFLFPDSEKCCFKLYYKSQVKTHGRLLRSSPLKNEY